MTAETLLELRSYIAFAPHKGERHHFLIQIICVKIKGGSRHLVHAGQKSKLLTLALATNKSKANFKSL